MNAQPLTGATCDWRAARWISPPENSRQAQLYHLFRREFEVDDRAHRADLHISADLAYRLTVNAEFVGDGPPRNTVVKMSYRSHDVTPLMRPGKNVVALELYGAQPQLHASDVDVSLLTGLICQLDLFDADGDRIDCLGSDEHWRVAPGHSWRPDAKKSAGYSRTEIYDARKEPQGWRDVGFDGSEWATPALDVTRDRFSELGDSYRPHTVLEPTSFAPVGREVVAPKAVTAVGEVTELDGSLNIVDIGLKMGLEPFCALRTCTIEDPDALLSAEGGPVTIMNAFPLHDLTAFYEYWDTHEDVPCVRNASLVLDFGQLMNAHFHLDIEGAGGIVDMAWGETLIEGRVIPRLYIAPGNLDISHADRYILRPGRQTWESFHYQPFRYVQLTFRNMEEPVKLHRFAAVKRDPAFEVRGRFRCSDDTLTWAWAAAERTLRLSTHDTIMDDTIREKGVWSGDAGGVAVPVAMACYGDNPIIRHFVRLFVSHRETNRFLHSHGDAWFSAPVGVPRYFLHPVRFAYALCDYFRYCSDPALLKEEIYPALKDHVAYLEGLCNGSGLIEDPPGHQWLDWAPVNAGQGEGGPQNLFFCLLLGKLARIARDYGETDDADRWASMASAVDQEIFARFWNAEAGLYVDSVVKGKQQTSRFSEQTNCLALLAGLGREGRGDIIVTNLGRQNRDLVRTDILFMMFTLSGLFSAGYDGPAVEMMRDRYTRMWRAGSDTIWEEWSYLMSQRSGTWLARYRALAHSGACAPAFILTTEVLGVKPTEFGFKRFSVHPKWGGLEWAEGAVPTPFGDIVTRWERRQGAFELALTVPEDTEADVVLPPAQSHTVDGRDLEGTERVEVTEAGGRRVTVGTGSYHFKAAGLPAAS